jgi:D-inositol-3-phosphate glycosyltransferase
MTIQRIAFLSVHTSPLAPMGGKKTGGMNVYIRELAQEFGSRGIAVDIFVRRSSHHEPKIDPAIGANVRVIYLNAGQVESLSPDDIYPHLSEFTANLMSFAMFHDLRYDIVYSHYWLSGWVASKLKEAWGIPFVQMFHTLGQMKQRILSHGNFLPDQRIRTEMQIMNDADRIIAATPAEHSQLLWLYRAKRRKIEIVPPGVNIERFQPLPLSEAKARIGIDPNTHMLLFVGRIEPLKSVDTIIEALHIIKEQDAAFLDSLRLMIVGGHPNDTSDTEMMRLQQLMNTLGLSDVVQFVGAKDQNDLPCYYAAATAVIMPSHYESFGMVALEAMASGTPVIATEVGGLAFLVRDNETGYLIPVREAHSLAQRIEQIIRDGHKREKMGQQASHLAQDYSWSKIADRLLTIFANVRPQQTAEST